jgi:phage-related tail fiber protein
MPFQTIHTDYGLQRLAQAESSGLAINLTHIAIGDGNGNATPPASSQTQLVRERYRAPVNRVYQSPTDPLRFAAEIVIPASVGGFTMREVGVFDDQGGLFVVGDLPATYKPTETDGAFSDTVLRIEFAVSSANVVTLQVDPNLTIATRTWVTNTISVCALLPGGTTGQVLRKKTNGCGDVEWTDPTVANVVVDVIEERQELVADQLAVTWNVVTTRGLAVYIEGVRLTKGAAADQWQEDPADPDTGILLGKAYPAGTEIVGVQNDPAGSVSFPLIRDQNLSDVPDKSLGRQNLGVFSREETRQMAPAGLIAHFARIVAPAGWLKANGAAISRTAYADLFAAIGTTFGDGDGFTTFNVPDLRGEFIRGVDDGRGVDQGRGLGSAQTDQNRSHTHTGSTGTDGSHSHSFSYAATQYSGSPGAATGNGFTNSSLSSSTSSAGSHSHSVSIGSSGGAEARPRNVALLACIKY